MNSEIVLLNRLYQNAKMGEESISYMLKGLKHTGSYHTQLRHSMEQQRQGYAQLSRKAERQLHMHREIPQNNNMMARFSAQMGIKMNMMKNRRPAHLAEMLIQGSTMGIIDATGNLHRCRRISPQAKELANQVITFEQKNIERLKNYL